MADDEKVELAAVPSNEQDDSKKEKEEDKDKKEVTVTVVEHDEDTKLSDLIAKCKCDIDLSKIDFKSWLDRTKDLNIYSISTYLFFYSIYFFHFIVFTVFVGETGWFDADYCKKSKTKDECLDKSLNGNLCDWTEWLNKDNLVSDYCDASYNFTFYQIILLFYFILYLLLWEILSALSSFVTLTSVDRIPKSPPIKSNVNPLNITRGGPTPGRDEIEQMKKQQSLDKLQVDVNSK